MIMTNPALYSMIEFDKIKVFSNNSTFICSINKEERSIKAIDYLISKDVTFKSIILIDYKMIDLKKVPILSKLDCDITTICITNNPADFLEELKKIPMDILTNDILLDISGIRTPEMFMLLKYLKVKSIEKINVLYSVPYDYVFEQEPFTSYKSCYGDLTTFELLGFGGSSLMDAEDCDLFIFLGFDGALSLKVIENCSYHELKIVNNLPALFPKYKDISILTNYNLMSLKHKSLFIPADNPFEVFNMLYEQIPSGKNACIAPLSTKPSSLGVCLYALTNENIRVVYPTSHNYNSRRTTNTYKTFQYEIFLNT